MKKAAVALIVALALCVPGTALAGPSPKGVAWQLTAALQKREKFLGKHYGSYGAKCVAEVPGKAWTCRISSRTLGAQMLFPSVTYGGGRLQVRLSDCALTFDAQPPANTRNSSGQRVLAVKQRLRSVVGRASCIAGVRARLVAVGAQVAVDVDA
jgi:hypothetical protein